MIQVELCEGLLRVHCLRGIDLSFSDQLPVRQVLRDSGYSLKGWWWCAFQEGLAQANMELPDPMQTFEEIWEQIKSS